MSDDRWSIEETKIFLQLCIANVNSGSVELIQPSPAVRNEHVYVQLTKSLKEYGFSRKTIQLRHKFKRLKYLYKHAKATNTPDKCQFYQLLDELLTKYIKLPDTVCVDVKNNDNGGHKTDKAEQKCMVNSIVIDPSSTEYANDANKYEAGDANYYNNIIHTDIEEDYDFDIPTADNKTTNASQNVVRAFWTLGELKKFIDICIADNWNTRLNNTRLNSHLYAELSKQFLEKTGYFRNIEQIRNKLRRLRILHHKSTQNIFSSELPRTFYGLLNILFDPKSISPKIECLEPDDRDCNINSSSVNTNKDPAKEIYVGLVDDKAGINKTVGIDNKDDQNDHANVNKYKNVKIFERWTISETTDFLKLCIATNILKKLRLKKGISSDVYIEIAERHHLQSNMKYNRSYTQIALKLKRLKKLYGLIRKDADAKRNYPYYDLLLKLFTMNVNQILNVVETTDIIDVPDEMKSDHIEVNEEKVVYDDIKKTESIIEYCNISNDEMIIDDDDAAAIGDNDKVHAEYEEEIDNPPNNKQTNIDDVKNVTRKKSSLLMLSNFEEICNHMKTAQLTLQENFFKQQQSLIDNQYKYELELQKREDHRFSDFLMSLSSIGLPNQNSRTPPPTTSKVEHNYYDENYDYDDDVTINEFSNNMKVIQPPSTLTLASTGDPKKDIKIIQIANVDEIMYNQLLNDNDDDDENDNNIVEGVNNNDGSKNEGGNYTGNDDGIIVVTDDSDEDNNELSDTDKESPIDPNKLKNALACFMCTNIFFNPKRLNEHIRYDHELPDLTCYTCDYKFDSFELLDEHWQYHKKGKRHMLRELKQKDDAKISLLCPKCGKTLPNKKRYWDHIRKHNPGFRKIKNRKMVPCPICGKTMLKNSLRGHIQIHSGKKEHKCDFCGKAFQQRSTLNLHRRMHTGRNYECLECNKRFVSAILLKYHARSHAEERLYPCDDCEKSYFTRQHLNQHVISNHSGGPAFKCDICFNQFRLLTSLKIHMYLHTGKPFKCEICPKEFTLRYKYKRHIVNVHKINNVIRINQLLQNEHKKIK